MKLIQISKMKSAMVDDEDYPVLSRIRWHLTEHGYVGHTRFYMHQLIMGFPVGGIVDHIDRDRVNNQKHNLRLVTTQHNTMNRTGQPSSASGMKGVFFRKQLKSKPWMASITKTIAGDKKTHYIGYFATKEEAARAYNAKAAELYGEYAYLNPVD